MALTRVPRTSSIVPTVFTTEEAVEISLLWDRVAEVFNKQTNKKRQKMHYCFVSPPPLPSPFPAFPSNSFSRQDFAAFDVDVTTEKPSVMSAFVGTVLATASRDFFDRPNPADVAVGVAYTSVSGDDRLSHPSKKRREERCEGESAHPLAFFFFFFF
jgi:hypothetical protein